MSTNNDWIKITWAEVKWPALLSVSDQGHVHWWRNEYDMKRCEPLWERYTHWKPAQLPAPPAPEPTQQCEDVCAFHNWFIEKGHSLSNMPRPVHAWHAALAYRDAQNAKDIRRLACGDWTEDMRQAYWSIRRRCGLDK